MAGMSKGGASESAKNDLFEAHVIHNTTWEWLPYHADIVHTFINPTVTFSPSNSSVTLTDPGTGSE
jgi:hypothetical protein